MLKRNEILALIIDWGYRPTACRSGCSGPGRRSRPAPRPSPRRPGAPIVHIADPRVRGPQAFLVTYSDPIIVASSRPAEIRRATQAIADALGATIAAAPEQWYSFKPLWPSTDEEQAVARRACRERRRRSTGEAVTGVDGPGALAPAG